MEPSNTWSCHLAYVTRQQHFRVMNTILRDGLDRFVLVFLDDILIFSRTREEHEQYIRAVLDRLRSEKFFCRGKKCEFYQMEVEYLGFDVGAYGVKPSIAKVRAWRSGQHLSQLRTSSPFRGLQVFIENSFADSVRLQLH